MPGPSKQFDTDVALQRAIDVFRAHGYEGASLSELTASMGIGRKSLYDTFGNKRSLFLKSLHRYTGGVAAELDERLGQPGSPLENLRGLLKDWETRAVGGGAHGCLIGNNIADFDCEDAEVAMALRAGLQRVEDAFAACLARARDAGELREGVDPRTQARVLTCLMQGSTLVGRVNIGSDEDTPAGVAEAALNLLSAR